MWKPVLPLVLLSCAPIVQAQLQSKQPELQKHVAAREAEVRTAAFSEAWVDPHQQLSRMLVANTVSERQIALRRDTDKLLSLANELKSNVDKTSPSILSLDVIKKAQEIEKLAKSVKDKMREAY
ncbi:MAG TPA: hypothetical protein VNW47_07455 [Terriglobales bacterium]|jgi:hypothetical protein|nr:hypothetical protein [Terriglobales bacterium]